MAGCPFFQVRVIKVLHDLFIATVAEKGTYGIVPMMSMSDSLQKSRSCSVTLLTIRQDLANLTSDFFASASIAFTVSIPLFVGSVTIKRKSMLRTVRRLMCSSPASQSTTV